MKSAKATVTTKKDVIETYKVHDTDTGSSNVQIALLTQRINSLVEHLKLNKKDHHGRRGLLILVARRRKLLAYLLKNDPANFKKITSKLKIKVKEAEAVDTTVEEAKEPAVSAAS